jgi:hypothetical protein
MGREIRRVPKGWEHPKDGAHYRPLFDGSFSDELARWKDRKAAWDRGEREDYAVGETMPFEEWDGHEPVREDYRPDWPAEQCVCFQVYENVSEGTPISPVFETREGLIAWLMNDGSGLGFGGTVLKLSREAAEGFANSGYAPSAVGFNHTGLVSGLAIHGTLEE